jgi:hypothetical protein
MTQKKTQVLILLLFHLFIAKRLNGTVSKKENKVLPFSPIILINKHQVKNKNRKRKAYPLDMQGLVCQPFVGFSFLSICNRHRNEQQHNSMFFICRNNIEKYSRNIDLLFMKIDRMLAIVYEAIKTRLGQLNRRKKFLDLHFMHENN